LGWEPNSRGRPAEPSPRVFRDGDPLCYTIEHKESSLGKALFSLFIVGLLLSAPVLAEEPPAHQDYRGVYQGGWGMNPTDWDSTDGISFNASGIWDPGHESWVVGYEGCHHCNPIYIEYAPITLDLWIELYCIQSYAFTHYMWHRIGNADEVINFYICGTVHSNNGEWVSLMAGEDDLGYLHFREDIFGHTGVNYGRDIPIEWQYAWDEYDHFTDTPPLPENIPDGDWSGVVTPNPNITFCIPDPCDHWFCFWGQFHILYHENDGHYQLVMAGCPAPEL